jgi:cytochrome P450
MTVTPEFDPLSSHFESNPYSEFKRMRESCRAYKHEGTLMPVVSFFHNEDIRAMLADHKNWSSQRSEEYNAKALGDAAILIGNDPPLHTKYRNIVAPLFLPSSVLPLAETVERQLDRAMEQCLDAGEINFVEDFAANVTVGMICELCGIPQEDWALVRRMTLDLGREDGRPVFWKQPHPEVEARVAKVMAEMTVYLNEHVRTRARVGGNDMISMLAREIDNPRHMVGLGILLIGAGNETTTNLMTHGLQELLRHPAQMEMLRADPGLIESAVEEMLRYRGTIRKQDRIATTDIEIDGVQIRKGDSIALWNASASRDPVVIERPEEFDIRRKPNRHLAFGSGIHMCIGNVLARLELRLALQRLLARTSRIETTRGEDSYKSLGNGVLEAAERFSVRLVS